MEPTPARAAATALHIAGCRRYRTTHLCHIFFLPRYIDRTVIHCPARAIYIDRPQTLEGLRPRQLNNAALVEIPLGAGEEQSGGGRFSPLGGTDFAPDLRRDPLPEECTVGGSFMARRLLKESQFLVRDGTDPGRLTPGARRRLPSGRFPLTVQSQRELRSDRPAPQDFA